MYLISRFCSYIIWNPKQLRYFFYSDSGSSRNKLTHTRETWTRKTLKKCFCRKTMMRLNWIDKVKQKFYEAEEKWEESDEEWTQVVVCAHIAWNVRRRNCLKWNQNINSIIISRCPKQRHFISFFLEFFENDEILQLCQRYEHLIWTWVSNIYSCLASMKWSWVS